MKALVRTRALSAVTAVGLHKGVLIRPHYCVFVKLLSDIILRVKAIALEAKKLTR